MIKFREEMGESISEGKKLENAIKIMLAAEKRVRSLLSKEELKDYESREDFYLAYEKLSGYLETRESL